MKSTDFAKDQICGKQLGYGPPCALRPGHENEPPPWPGFTPYCMADVCPRQHIGGTGIGVCLYCILDEQAELRSLCGALADEFRRAKDGPLKTLRGWAWHVASTWIAGLVADRLRP